MAISRLSVELASCLNLELIHTLAWALEMSAAENAVAALRDFGAGLAGLLVSNAELVDVPTEAIEANRELRAAVLPLVESAAPQLVELVAMAFDQTEVFLLEAPATEQNPLGALELVAAS